jgi:quinol monooxygenase YgiN
VKIGIAAAIKGVSGLMAPKTVRMSVEWTVPFAQARSMAIALQSLAASVKPHHGCLSCVVSMGVAHHATLRYIEEWATEDDLRTRLRADGFPQLFDLTEGLSRPPRVEFVLPFGATRGDFLAEVSAERRHERVPRSRVFHRA